MNLLFHQYKSVFQLLSGKNTEKGNDVGITNEFPSVKKNSLAHAAYEQRVNNGIIAPQQDCSNCVCFGDEWPL